MYNKKESVEDYLEKVLMLEEQLDNIRAIDLAKFMSFSKASVSVALKKLKSYGYLTVEEDTGFIHLTDSGRKIAKDTYERHELIAESLMHIGVSKETALADACALEHIISEETFNALKEVAKRRNNK